MTNTALHERMLKTQQFLNIGPFLFFSSELRSTLQ